MNNTTADTDIVAIIKACGQNGVSSFKLGEIEIIFNGFVIHKESDYPSKVAPTGHVPVDPKFQDQIDYETVQENTDLLMITDPAAYEESLFKGELEESESDMEVDNE